MQFLTFQYRSRREAEEDLEHLWRVRKVRGELALRTDKDDVTFLEIAAEREIPPAWLEKLKGVRL
jgi:hypothetical protein